MMQAPKFWASRLHPAALALAPLGWLYGAVAHCIPKPTSPIAIPSLCVGNLTMGGSGKTPVVRRFAHALQAMDLRPHIISRGYGSSADHALRVEPQQHSSAQVGDEPLMLARDGLQCWVGSNRQSLASHAMQAGASCIISDDGMQSRSLNFTQTIAVIDGPYGFGNGRVFPAGPLRQCLSSALPHIDHAIIIGDDPQQLSQHFSCPVWHAKLQLNMHSIAPLQNIPLLAFAGIGRPNKFFNSLHHAGLNVQHTHPFPDHHRFTEPELAALEQQADAIDAQLICTEKDWVRLSPSWQQRIQAAPATLEFACPDALPTMLDKLV